MMKMDGKLYSAAYISVALVICASIGATLISKDSGIKAAIVMQERVIVTHGKEWVKKSVPVTGPSGLVVFGNNGDAFLAGNGRLLVSRDQGKTWSKLEGGEGSYRITADGGLTYRNSERNNSSSAWIGVGELCSVEAGAITESGRLFLTSVCEHSTQLWSIPTTNSGLWFVTGFTYESEPSDGVYSPRGGLIARGNLVTVSAALPSGSAILTTDDGGFSWRPLWKASNSTSARAFDFLDDRQGILLVSNGELLQTDDGGKRWAPTVAMPTRVAKQVNSIRLVSKETLVAAGDHGMVLVSNDSGLSWREYSIEPSIDWYNVVTGVNGLTWISGNSNVVIETSDPGRTWLRAKLPFDRNVYSRLTSDGHLGWTAFDEFVLHSPAAEH